MNLCLTVPAQLLPKIITPVEPFLGIDGRRVSGKALLTAFLGLGIKKEVMEGEKGIIITTRNNNNNNSKIRVG